MGRTGLEPVTLGLKVRPDKRQRAVAKRNVLQIGQNMVATNYSK
jgi:hypothetical protein